VGGGQREELGIRSYELRITNYEVEITNFMDIKSPGEGKGTSGRSA